MGMKKKAKSIGGRQTAADRKQLEEAREILLVDAATGIVCTPFNPNPKKQMVFGVIHEFGRDPQVMLFSSQKKREAWITALFAEYEKEYDQKICSAQNLIEASRGDVELCTFDQYLDGET